MENGHEVPLKSPQHSHSSSDSGTAAAATASETPKKNNLDSNVPDVNGEGATSPSPRSFLKSSFGQRLSAQCGSVFLDTNHSPRQVFVDGSSIVDSEQRSRLGSGRGSSGLSEADAKGMAVVAEATTPGIRPASSGGQVLKIWGFPPSALPRHRAMAMVGASSIERQAQAKRDASPLRRAACGLAEPGKTKPDLEQQQQQQIQETSKARCDLDQGNSKITTTSFEDARKAGGGTDEAVVGREQHGSFLNSLGHLVQVPPLSNAAESDAPTAETNGKRPSFKNDCGFLKLLPSKRKFSPEDHEVPKPSNYVLGDRHGKSLSAEGDQAMRLSSNSSGGGGNVVSKRSLGLHFKTTSANDLGMKEFINRDSSHGKERRISQEQGSNGKPIVGSSFMRWMIDVGKGLAKKRCFGSEHDQQAPVQSTGISPLSSPIAGICTADPVGHSKASSNFNMVSRMCDSSKPSEDGRTGLSPQSVPQSFHNMDTEEPASDKHAGSENRISSSSPNAGNMETAEGKSSSPEEMHTSGDEQLQQEVRQSLPAKVADEREGDDGGGVEKIIQQEDLQHNDRVMVQEPELENSNTKTDTRETSGNGNGASNSQNATDGPIASKDVPASSLDVNKDRICLKQQNEQEHVKVSRSSKKVESGEEASLDMWRSGSSYAVAQQEKKHADIHRGTYSKANAAASSLATADMASECSQGMAEFVASMASVKSWVIRNRNITGQNSNNNSMVISSRKGQVNNKTLCNFCGLGGHVVSDCSETLDCELKDLERRSAVLDDMKTELKDLPCLRCLGMGHLGAQCRFSVTEAASRARENSELRSWNFTKKMTSRTASPPVVKEPVIWTQNSNVIAAALQHEVEKRMITNGAGTKINRTSPSDKNTVALKERKNDVSPKENAFKKIGATKVAGDAVSKRKNTADLPPIPKNMLSSIEAVRLSRSELWRWVESPHLNTQVRGFFLRLRFGRWEKDLGGTGYRMARIRGAMKKNGTEEKNMSVSVDLGDLECTVDSQYVSNHPFTEAELIEWWRGRWKSGKRVISEAELQAKMSQRSNL